MPFRDLFRGLPGRVPPIPFLGPGGALFPNRPHQGAVPQRRIPGPGGTPLPEDSALRRRLLQDPPQARPGVPATPVPGGAGGGGQPMSMPFAQPFGDFGIPEDLGNPFEGIMDLLREQQNQERLAELAEIDAILARLQSEEVLGTADIEQQREDLLAQLGFQEREAQRALPPALAGAVTGFAGQGAALGGARLGAEGRLRDALGRRMAGIGLERQRGMGALERALERIRTETGLRRGELEERRGVLQGALSG